MSNGGRLYTAVLAAAGAILTYPLLIPPIVGFADPRDLRADAVGQAARPGARPRLDRSAGGVDGCRLRRLLEFVLRRAGFLHLLPAVAGRSRGDRQSGRDRPARYRPVVVMVGPL